MKIKAVCEATSLTDRTVRYYIDEGLLFPDYAENYLGRKTFDFSQADIDRLKEISVLRRFGFSISEIREMIQHPEQIIPISEQLCLRKQNTIDEEQQLLQTLTRLNPDFPYTVSKLAECLSEPIGSRAAPVEDNHWRFDYFFEDVFALLGGFILIWLPVVLSVCALINKFRMFHYPAFSPCAVTLALLSLLPSLSLLVLPRIHLAAKPKDILRRVLQVLCVFSLLLSPALTSCIISHSETTDFRNYREFDAACLVNRNDVFHALFPRWVDYFDEVTYPDGLHETVYFEDAQYYYHYSIPWETKYDVYVQAPLKKEAFDTEVTRAVAVLEEYAQLQNRYTKYLVMDQGAYRCHILYSSGTVPFEPRDEFNGAYDYCIFAYDQEKLLVRYLCCYSQEGCGDIPYYTELEW